MSRRMYQPLDLSRGYAAGSNLFYECLRCGDAVPSLPPDSLGCSCGNIHIDVDYGRIAIEDNSKVRVFMCEEK